MTEEESKVLVLDKDDVNRKVQRYGNSFFLSIPRRYLIQFANFLDTPFSIQIRVEDGEKKMVIEKSKGVKEE